MNPAWFLYTGGAVTGPFTTDDVKAKLRAGNIAAGTYIWWKGQRDWIAIDTWENKVNQMMKNVSDVPTKPIWYADIAGTQKGPVTLTELMQILKPVSQLNKVRLWSVGMEKWTSVFEVGEVLDMLGLARRENERAPLMGTVAVSRSNDDPRSFLLKNGSISVAGMGFSGQHDLRIGDNVTLLIRSPEFTNSMHLQGDVAYVTGNGYVGVRFDRVHPETQAVIIDYVKRFSSEIKKSSAA